MTRTSTGAAKASATLSIRRPQLSDRERFIAMLTTGPVMPADAIVLLAGEDSAARVDVTVQLYATLQAQPTPPAIIVTGGVHDPPRVLDAYACQKKLAGHGLNPQLGLHIDFNAQNTYEQAVFAVTLAKDKDWRQMLLIASPYHAHRAFLTFLRVVQDAGLAEKLRIVPVVNPAVKFAKWSDTPPGTTDTRLDLLHDEFRKIDDYANHVASYTQAIEYLTWWERNG